MRTRRSLSWPRCPSATAPIAAVLLSGAPLGGLLPLLLVFVGTCLGMHGVSFCVRFFLLFPRLARQSAARMADTWYLTRLKACYTRAA